MGGTFSYPYFLTVVVSILCSFSFEVALDCVFLGLMLIYYVVDKPSGILLSSS